MDREVLGVLERVRKADASCRVCRKWFVLDPAQVQGDAPVCPECGSALEADNCVFCGRFLHEFVDGGPGVRYVGAWLRGRPLCPVCLGYVKRVLGEGS